MDSIRKLYGKNLITEKDRGIEHFAISNETGKGEITLYHLFEGVDLAINDIRMEYYKTDGELHEDMIELSHCQYGRHESYEDKNSILFIFPGDTGIKRLTNNIHQTSFFPTEYYYGASIYIHCEQLENNPWLEAFSIDASKIQALVGEKETKIFKPYDALERIFNGIYGKEDLSKEYLKIKVLELLFLITNKDWREKEIKGNLMPRRQVEKMKEIKAFLLKNIYQHVTIEELCELFSISSTALKTQFKTLYGDSIYQYTKKVRLEKAKELMRDDGLTIAEIAMEIGYSNPAKFSSAFKKEYGIPPSQYNVQMDKN